MAWPTFDISGASYANKSKSLAAQDTASCSIFFKPDGTKLYYLGANDYIYQYALSTAWDVSTASYETKRLYYTDQGASAFGLWLSADGSKLYRTNIGTGNRRVYQYTLSTPWDVSTGSFSNKSIDVDSLVGTPYSIAFNSDGTKMYVGSLTEIYQYTLSTGWDISTASSASKSKAINSQETQCRGIRFNDAGTKLYIVGYSSDKVHQYTLSTAWDISTASYDTIYYSPVTQEDTPYAVAFKDDDGSQMYVMGGGDTVFQYTTYSTTNIKTINGLAKASVKTVNVLAIASVKTINGLS